MTSAVLDGTETIRAQPRHYDVIIVGAGLSGIAAGYYVQSRLPNKSFVIFEGRETMGGTWDLFRYPGVRSDSDMHTLGYGFRPWPSEQSITDGPSILEYVRDTARIHKLDEKIRYGHRVVNAAWSSADAQWTLEVRVAPGDTIERITCGFLFMCSGYYDYAEGYTPEWADRERFGGSFVHPQFWPADLDYAGKRVVIIGSGATAVTLAPSMAETAAHVTMLQRSPTYIIARPAIDPVAKWAQKKLPGKLAGTLVRWKNVLLGMVFFNLSRKRPAMIKKLINKGLQHHLGEGYDIATHFTPTYNPWDQRLCLVPDADLFRSIRAGKVSIETDHIERFTEAGLQLKSGKHLDADVIVGATGLKIQLMGGMQVSVDGRPVDFGKKMNYKGMMYDGVPNLASAFGYTNASWTLKCELTAKYVCRLIAYMDAKKFVACVPTRRDPKMGEQPALDFTSGYVLRAAGILPKQGTKKPWRLYQNYALDLASLRFGKVADGSMKFVKKRKAARAKR